MKYRVLFLSLFTVLGGFVFAGNQPVKAAATIIKCSGQIPNKTACLIEAGSYGIDTYRVDLCQESPFPDFRSSADYAGSGCMTLFNGKGSLYKWRFPKVFKYKLPSKGRENIKPGRYQYLTMVVKNDFTTSGKYTSGKTTWRTKGGSAKTLGTSKGEAVEFKTKLQNWRGIMNQDNDYCDNNGGTFSRCEIKYNGYKLTGIGIGKDFIETYGPNVEYVFYMVELLSPITLTKEMDGFFDMTFKNNLEVYGNGTTVQSISIAPFVFQATYTSN